MSLGTWFWGIVLASIALTATNPGKDRTQAEFKNDLKANVRIEAAKGAASDLPVASCASVDDACIDSLAAKLHFQADDYILATTYKVDLDGKPYRLCVGAATRFFCFEPDILKKIGIGSDKK